MVLLVTGTPGTSREVYSEDAKLNAFPAIAIELFSSIARALGL